MRVPLATLIEQLQRVLLTKNFTPERAALCARLFAETDRDGVYSHGLNRFPRFLQYIQKGYVQPTAEPILVAKHGSFERWDGQRGPGNLNAHKAMEQAIALAKEQGMGSVAVGNTNHWMRGGTYGWQAADAGCLGICFTNTIPNVPPWGGKTPTLGNNPFIMAVPQSNGQHVVLDMALSQFSYGKLQAYADGGNALPVPGGYNAEGNLTQDAAAIMETGRALPIGFWKGSGLSLLLDLAAGLLSGGRTTGEVAQLGDEYGVSQVFMCFDLSQFQETAFTDAVVQQVLTFTKGSTPIDPNKPVLYPGENAWRTREENTRLGIPVDPAIWQQVLAM